MIGPVRSRDAPCPAPEAAADVAAPRRSAAARGGLGVLDFLDLLSTVLSLRVLAMASVFFFSFATFRSAFSVSCQTREKKTGLRWERADSREDTTVNNYPAYRPFPQHTTPP